MERDKIIILGLVIIIIALIVGIFMINSGDKSQTSHIDILGNGTVPEGGSISANLSSNGTVLEDKQLHISLVDGDGKEVFNAHNSTNSKGLAKFNLKNVSAGNYTVKITFEGNENYTSSIAMKELEIVKKAVQTTASTSSSSSSDTTSSQTQSGQSEEEGYYEDGVWYFYDEESGGYYRVADFEGEGYEISDQYGNWIWTDADWNVYDYGNIYEDNPDYYY